MNMFRKKRIIEWFGLLVVAFIFVAPFHYHIGLLSQDFLPEQEVKIKVKGSADGNPAPVTIYYEGQSNEIFLKLKDAAEGSVDWIFHEGERGVSWTYLSSTVLDATLTIRIKPSTVAYLCFESNGRNGIAEIDTSYSQKQINTHSDSGSTELLRVYPFEGTFIVSFVTILTWIVFIAGVLGILSLFSKLAERFPWTRYILLTVMAVGYLLYYSVTTSPLYPNLYGGDSAFFILVGKGMKYGYLPYRDFYDMKGPWLFILEWLGQLVSEGRFGAFLLQCVNMIGAIIMFDKLIGIGRKKRTISELGLIFPLFLTAIFSVGGGNLTEELSLFPLSIVLYLGTKYLMSEEKEHRPLYAGIYGFLFSALALIRISNAALICSVVITIIVILIVKQQWINLAKNAVAFIIGFLVAALPMIIFFAAHGLLSEMIDQVFIYGSKYAGLASISSGLTKMFTGAYKESLHPIYVGLIATLIFFRTKRWQITLLIWISTLATLASIAISGRNYEHYYCLLVPVVALDVWFIWDSIHETGWRKIAALICGASFVLSYRGTYLLDQKYVNRNIVAEVNLSSEMAIVDVASRIADNGSVYCWTSQPRWYMYADKFPSCRYCGWQTDQMAIDPSVRDGLSDMFLSNPPQWLVLANDNSEFPEFVSESRDRYFEEAYRNHYWILYQNRGNIDI